MKQSDVSDLASLEARIGHEFADRALLLRALSHTSTTLRPGENYQRLEFLGDRVLALAVARMLYDAFPGESEGDLAPRLNALVRRDTCADVARDLGLGRHMRIGPSEAQSGGREKAALLGDIAEAVIAAIYLDGGIAPAMAFVDRHWRHRMTAAVGAARDPKTTLQEWAQGRALPPPHYREKARTGPDHAPRFVMTVHLQGLEPLDADGASKREAEQNAARALLLREKVWTL